MATPWVDPVAVAASSYIEVSAKKTTINLSVDAMVASLINATAPTGGWQQSNFLLSSGTAGRTFWLALLFGFSWQQWKTQK